MKYIGIKTVITIELEYNEAETLLWALKEVNPIENETKQEVNNMIEELNKATIGIVKNRYSK